ncbi:DUF2846 domain-containing protein [Ferrimonas sp. YFM]|uniref:DUF2846 domain-containing protein n=1 Tax=Ferrimonas sp. YFM TaxID=3028878 RepID=UPI0025722D86|nr:DUF2846 domain-containing protein [Ferrimonas sp. YFM]BDY05014.1 hypothetical protein F0521_20550 [Ferrimonas sp. YFM]
MSKRIIALAACSLLFAGCASVPMENSELSNKAKEFSAPSEGKAGLYVFRSGAFGAALKKDVWVDGECMGETAPNMFFFKEIDGNKEHKVSTESEFSPNDLMIETESGKNYFVRQYIKMGVFVGGAGVELVDEETGKKEVAPLKLAKQGKCSKKS